MFPRQHFSCNSAEWIFQEGKFKKVLSFSFYGVLSASTCYSESKVPSAGEYRPCKLVSLHIYYFSLGSIPLQLFDHNVLGENMAHFKVSTKGDHIDQLLYEFNSATLVQQMDNNIVFVGQLVHSSINQAKK